MSWVKHDDNTAHHPKVTSVPLAARWVWFASTCYASRHLTDGFIPRNALKLVTPEATPAIAAVLVHAGLWDAVDDGWHVHDFLDFQPSAATIKAKRDADRRRKESNGNSRGEKHDRPQGIRAESDRIPKRSRARDPVPSRPVPENTRTSAPPVVPSPPGPAGRKPVCVSDVPADPGEPKPEAVRAAAFLERYQALYTQFRNGASYHLRPALDYVKALELCTTWTDDAWLDDMAEIFLRTDHQFAASGSRTVGQFLALASWCDSRLREQGLTPGKGATA